MKIKTVRKKKHLEGKSKRIIRAFIIQNLKIIQMKAPKRKERKQQNICKGSDSKESKNSKEESKEEIKEKNNQNPTYNFNSTETRLGLRKGLHKPSTNKKQFTQRRLSCT